MSTPTGEHDNKLTDKLLSVPAHQLYALNSAHSSDSSLQRIKNQPGYNTPVFKGKEEQRALVEQEVAAKVSVIGAYYDL